MLGGMVIHSNLNFKPEPTIPIFTLQTEHTLEACTQLLLEQGNETGHLVYLFHLAGVVRELKVQLAINFAHG